MSVLTDMLTRHEGCRSKPSLRDLEWAAGFLEGEGSFWISHKNKGGLSQIPFCGAAQVQRWPLDKLHSLFGGKIRRRDGKGNQQDYWYWSVSGQRAAGLSMTLYTFLSPKRKSQIGTALTSWKTRPAWGGYRHLCVNGHPFDRIVKSKKQKRACSICQASNQMRYREKKRVANS